MNAIRHERRADGKLAAWVFPQADRVLLRRCVELLCADFEAEQRERFDGIDQLYWDLLVAGMPVTLYWQSDAGVAVFAGEVAPSTEALVGRLAQHLSLRIRP
jgi:hypothetical protein